MSTLTDLINAGSQKVVRKCYLKRREVGDTIESNWVRIDNYNGRDRVIKWGSIVVDVDTNPGQVGTFTIPKVSMTFDNTESFWDIESETLSYWYGYLTRQFSLMKITVAYLDEDDTETSEVTEFEGVITRVNVTEDDIAQVQATGYGSILNSYDVVDRSYSTTQSVNTIVTDLVTQSKISKYITSYSVSANTNVNILSGSLTGSYWEVIRKLALLSGSIVLISGSSFEFKARTAGVSSVWTFKGRGNPGGVNIFKVTNYDPEGADDVRLKWVSSDGATVATDTNATNLAKYLDAPQTIDLSLLATGTDKTNCLAANLARYNTPTPKIEFTTTFLAGEVAVLDRITMSIFGRQTGGIWDAFNWDDGTTWYQQGGGISVSGDWYPVKITKDLHKWVYKIQAEKVV